MTAFRLVRPYEDDTAAHWSPAHTLTELYEPYIRPNCLAGRHEDTIRGHLETLKLWAELTENPPVGKLNRPAGNKTLADFARALEQRRGKQPHTKAAAATILKHCCIVEYLLRLLGPSGAGRDRAALDLIDAPAMLPPDLYRRLSRQRSAAPTRQPWQPAEIAALIASARTHARWPRKVDIPAPLWWESLLTTLYYTGWRIGTAWEFRWTWIRGQTIECPPEAMKLYKTKNFPITPPLAAALDLIRGPRELVYPFDCCEVELYREFGRIIDGANLPKNGRKFHAIRRTTAIAHVQTSGPDAARYAMGHAQLQTLIGSYVGDAALATFAAALPLLPPIPSPPT